MNTELLKRAIDQLWAIDTTGLPDIVRRTIGAATRRLHDIETAISESQYTETRKTELLIEIQKQAACGGDIPLPILADYAYTVRQCRKYAKIRQQLDKELSRD